MSGRGDDFHALGKQWAEGRTGLEACIPALRLLMPCPVNAAQIIRNCKMRRRSTVREAHCRAAHPVPMVEQVVHIIHMPVGPLHRLPQYSPLRRGAVPKTL